jgi:hypothetical protein
MDGEIIMDGVTKVTIKIQWIYLIFLGNKKQNNQSIYGVVNLLQSWKEIFNSQLFKLKEK